MKLSYVMLAGGCLWSQASEAGLWALCSGRGICDGHTAHLFEVSRLGSANTRGANTRGCSGQETTHAPSSRRQLKLADAAVMCGVVVGIECYHVTHWLLHWADASWRGDDVVGWGEGNTAASTTQTDWLCEQIAISQSQMLLTFT